MRCMVPAGPPGYVVTIVSSHICIIAHSGQFDQDVDLLAMVPHSHRQLWDAETLKLKITQVDSSFYCERPNNPAATYMKLYFRLSGNALFSKRACKVDIFLPGTLNLPFIPEVRVDRIQGLPVMPIIPLLLMKLQGWEDWRNRPIPEKREKQYTDIRDVQELLEIACMRGAAIHDVWWLPREFVTEGKKRLARYLQLQVELWNKLGVDVGQTLVTI